MTNDLRGSSPAAANVSARTEASAASSRVSADRDGCDCPPWIIACAHFEGRLLLLGSRDFAVPMLGPFHGVPLDAFWVISAPEQGWAICPCPGCRVPFLERARFITLGRREKFKNGFETEDAALAAFHEAEEALLRGEA